MRESLLRDIGQDRISASKGNDRGFAEEDSLLKEGGIPA
jgi:hypothetical protein